jgi:type II secretory pathway pseudopilin PulG
MHFKTPHRTAVNKNMIQAIMVPRGISLLEVLISMGILSVGLASVLALIPAGGAQARRAMIEDRRGALGASVLADLATRGIFKQENWIPAASPPVVFDGLGDLAQLPATRFPPELTKILVTNATPAVIDDFYRGQDDLVYSLPEDDTLAPTPKYLNSSKRLSEGNFSWLATIVPAQVSGTPDFFRVSVVAFYQRPMDNTDGEAFASFAATTSGPSAEIVTSMSKDIFRALFSTGSVVLATNGDTIRWLKVLMASPTENATGDMIVSVDLTFNVDTFDLGFNPTLPSMVYAYAGAVGVAEKVIRLEGESPWSSP